MAYRYRRAISPVSAMIAARAAEKSALYAQRDYLLNRLYEAGEACRYLGMPIEEDYEVQELRERIRKLDIRIHKIR